MLEKNGGVPIHHDSLKQNYIDFHPFSAFDTVPVLDFTLQSTITEQYLYTPLFPLPYIGNMEVTYTVVVSGTRLITFEVRTLYCLHIKLYCMCLSCFSSVQYPLEDTLENMLLKIQCRIFCTVSSVTCFLSCVGAAVMQRITCWTTNPGITSLGQLHLNFICSLLAKGVRKFIYFNQGT